MKIVPLETAPSDHLSACLALVEARDPLVPPTDPTLLVRGEGLVALATSEHELARCGGPLGAVMGVGWRMPLGQSTLIEVRVPPGRRRLGVGSALTEALTEGDPRVSFAGCDAGHPRVSRFLARRGFSPEGLMFHLRWDGAPDEVPPGFMTALVEQISPTSDLVDRLVSHFGQPVWPPLHPVLPIDLEGPSGLVLSASVDGVEAGLAAAHRVDGTEPLLQIDALSVTPRFRGRGVGRCLLLTLMRAAAREDRGIILKVPASDEDTLRWAQGLGFWTAHPWCWFSRPPRDGAEALTAESTYPNTATS